VKRGPYLRGRESRELILTTALDVVGHKGFGATSLRDIAAAAGMTQAGLLHHFGTKESLLIEVLRKRDEVNRAQLGDSPDEDLPLTIRLARHNLQIPGLIHLFVSLEAAAGDPQHPCHAYFRERDAVVHRRVTRDIERRQEAGTFDPDADADVVARMLLALSDGLQAEWAVDPSIDVPGVLEAFWRRYVRAPVGAATARPTPTAAPPAPAPAPATATRRTLP
jgi:beta-glucosidase